MGNIKYVRPTLDEYFMSVREAVAKRATCNRGRSGCVIVKEKHIISTGYVGAPAGLPSCDEVGHLLQDVINSDDTVSEHCIRTVHAEQNAICQAAKLGMSIDGASLYCTMTPCRVCAMLIINCGIKEVICQSHYPHDEQEDNSISMLNSAGVKIRFITDELARYEED